MATQWRESNRAKRLPKNWQALRTKVKHRANNQCEHTDEHGRCKATGTDCDHITPGDNHTLDNLQWLCRYHHNQKTSRQANQVKHTNKRPQETHPGLKQE